MLKLYRFQPIVVPGDDRLEKLVHGNVRMSDPKTFNDPMDMQMVIKDLTERWSERPEHKENIKKALVNLIGSGVEFGRHRLFDGEVIEVFKLWCVGTLPPGDSEENQLIRAVKNALDKFGVCCLTPILESVLMWAHYADDGKGFCIEYWVDWGHIPNDFLYLPVQYLSHLQDLCITEAMFTPHQFLNRALASKHSDWAYEREIRIVYCKGKSLSAPIPDNFMKIAGLIAGLNMPVPLQAHLKETGRILGVPVYRMVKKCGYELCKEPMQ
jgi:hypothetical protein